MRESAHGQQSGFAIWLRTGRWPDRAPGAAIERKFNPWHDPDDGRFTFAGQGRHYGSGGAGSATAAKPRKRGKFNPGGGSFGGAGASGSFGKPARAQPKSPPRKIPTQPGAVPGHVPFKRRPSIKPATTQPVRTPPWRKVVRNGYVFQLDEMDNTRRIDGTLANEAKTPRSRAAQRNAGKPDRRPSDDGGHFIANRFNGPKEAFNHFAQDASANRGAYRVL